MTGHYEYAPYIWPMLASPALLLVPAAYAWRHRSAPGALPFVTLVLTMVPWALGAALEIAALEPATKIFWLEFQGVWQLPAATAALWFALEYADLGRWLTRRTVALLAVPPLVVLVLVLGGATRPLLCSSYALETRVRCILGPAGWVLVAYGFALALAGSLVFLWLLLRSPMHRWPAALCLCGHVAVRVGFLLDTSDANPVAPMDATVLASTVAALTYALALFGFRMFELIPVARWTLIEQMREGVLVLDSAQRIVDLNPAAVGILGTPAERARGRPARDLLPSLPDESAWPAGPGASPAEISLGPAGAPRHYELASVRPAAPERVPDRLPDRVARRDRAEAGTGAPGRARSGPWRPSRSGTGVARELHDSLGQVLGYAKMQAQAARGLLARGRSGSRPTSTSPSSSRWPRTPTPTCASTSSAHGRGGWRRWSSCRPWRSYLRRFRATYGIAATLEASTELAGRALEPMVGAQLLRIIQETLTNVRKHARARAVRISLSLSDGQAQAIVQDDGQGFLPAQLEAAEANTFGLRFMRERAHGVGGTVEVRSVPHEGTRVVITVPLQGRAS